MYTHKTLKISHQTEQKNIEQYLRKRQVLNSSVSFSLVYPPHPQDNSDWRKGKRKKQNKRGNNKQNIPFAIHISWEETCVTKLPKDWSHPPVKIQTLTEIGGNGKKQKYKGMKMCAYNWKMHPPRKKNKNKMGVESQSTICWKRKINDKKSNHNTINHNS